MDVTITKSDLSKVLFLSQSVVERKTGLPILANILLGAADGKLRISASDLEITTISTAPAKVTAKGSTTVNARVFNEIVKELPDGDVRIKLTQGERIEIAARSSKWKVIGVGADEYPSLAGIGFEVKSKLPAKQILEMITHTIYAVSQDEMRFNLSGVCFEMVPVVDAVKGGKVKKGERLLRLVATDGHRLSMVTRPVSGLDFEGTIIVPRKGLAEIRKILDAEGERDVGIAVIDGFLIVEGADAKVSVRLIDGEFPDYHQVLPKSKGQLLTLKSGELSQALRRVALMVTDKGKCVRFDLSKGALKISSSSPELGEASEELAVQFNGDPLSVGFNARYMLDITGSLNEDQSLVIELNGELGPGKFYPESDESYVAIVMPMRLL